MRQKPKILVIDIETSPILAHVWNLWDQNIALNQIQNDWHLLAFAAKWLGDPPNKTIYMDQRHSKNIEDDKKLLETIWNLLDSAEILLTHNGKKFDLKKLNARFILNNFKPVANIKHIDTYQLARKHFGFTNNKLEYLTSKLCTKYKKQSHKAFPGFELWRACLAGNKQAWIEMEKYNKMDVLSLEELYQKIAPWDNTINFNLYREDNEIICNCGSMNIQKRGFGYTKLGKFQQYQCKDCGSWTRNRKSLFTQKKKESLHV